MELLSPAGSFDALKAAVSAGCDAVYMGGGFLNARMNAANFTDEELCLALDYCHVRGVKAYITVNTLLTDRELGQLFDYAAFLYKNGADAVLVQDLGAAAFLKRNIPELELHASTQMGLCNLDGVNFAQSAGCTRAVLARELSDRNIEYITRNADIETEIFVHGAMCASASGYCLMSSFIGRRSGNRGKCAQPCRLKYTAADKEGYLMSLKDMMLIQHIRKLCDMGVASVKIEGRMKSPGYVGTVTETYRRAIDGEEITDRDIERLQAAFDRGGYTDGYFAGHNQIFAYNKPETTYGEQSFEASEKKTEIKLSAVAKIGKPIEITASCGEFFKTACGSFVCEEAKKRAVTEDDIISRMNKLGDTPFFCNDASAVVDMGLMVPLGEISSVRREAVSALEQEITKKREFNGGLKPLDIKPYYHRGDLSISASVQTLEQFNACADADIVYLPIELLYKNADAFKDFDNRIVLSLPKICHDHKRGELFKMIALAKESGLTAFAASNAADIDMCSHSDYSVWVYNSETADYLCERGIAHFCVSPEINLAQLKNFRSPIGCEAVVYGKIPVMVTKNCFVGAAGKCGTCQMRDRTGKTFATVCRPDFEYSEVLNSVPVYLGDRLYEFKNTCVSTARLIFTNESKSEVADVFKRIKLGSEYGGEFTRGHYYRGV